jgi:DNA-binding LacI/PurR family transcriptional regulator
MPTIKDVAREAGVSIATVSYVLNNKRHFVSEETRRVVLEAIARVGYTPNITARNLKSAQTRLIGYAWHQVPEGQVNSTLDYFIYSLARAVESAGYHLLTFTHPNNDPVPVYDELIRTQRVDAFVLSGTLMDDARVPFLIQARFPFIAFGRSNPDWSFPYVDIDGGAGVRQATDYLLQLGHQRIAVIAWSLESTTGRYRLAGYQQAMQTAGLTIAPEWIYSGSDTEESGRMAVQYWQSLPVDQRPTAIVALSDIVAIGAMDEAARYGLVVGRDLSVIGFDDSPVAQYVKPALTTLRQPIPEVCQTLVMSLETILSKTPPESPPQILIPPQLVVRESCHPIPPSQR